MKKDRRGGLKKQMERHKKSGKAAKQSESKINLTAAILNLITAVLILIDKMSG